MKCPKSTSEAVFLDLLVAGLWQKEVRLRAYGEVNYQDVYRIAQEQAVVGLLAEGLDYVSDVKIPQKVALLFASEVLQIESRNEAMNAFIAHLYERLRKEGIDFVLVKGQGIAQCYNKPLWRSAGDIDLFLTKDNYINATSSLSFIASSVSDESKYKAHKSFFIGPWEVELHGTLRTSLWKSLDRVIDEVQDTVFTEHAIRAWINNGAEVLLPRIDEDIVIVFTHILQHYYREGVGLRQICDWCRLLWRNKDAINIELLEKRIINLGVMKEWKAFGALAVDVLGMHPSTMPFYDTSCKWKNKAYSVLDFVMTVGNFGQNQDVSYKQKYSVLVRKLITLWRLTSIAFNHLFVFPYNTIRSWSYMFYQRITNILT